MNWKTLGDTHLRRLKPLVFLAALLPLGLLLTAAWQEQLGANPIEKITHNTGYWTLTFLLISLGVTPLRQLSGVNWLIRLRRMLGLFAFFYACLHFLTYLVLDQFFDWSAIAKDILKRPYITVGFAAFLLLIPLAVTSTNAMQRRLGGKNWKRLHRLAYLIAGAGVAHFAWLVKKDLSRPLLFGAVLAVLLGLRWFYRFRASRLRRSYSSV
ncbi:sulfite oxidase heme-binding subunit YedZ [Methylomonas fluvii]|uniref:sulfite oxidase heme-binding subunit YedZ n=1 Tax=Methylomonas fluvii TaxID=1854564 RepID=UPI001CAA8453|nr:protein-methionine-sulfoxide reductase heme-binding subunit MsrQ [Methylomonas fluvii]